MEVVGNVIKINTNKRNLTTVNLETADESWAEKLIDDCDADDKHIYVQSSESSDSHIFSDFEEIDASTLSLSAIDIQMLENLDKQQALELAQQQQKPKSVFSWSGIKRFFYA